MPNPELDPPDQESIDLDEDFSDHSSMEEPDVMIPEMSGVEPEMFGAILSGVLSNYFEYEHDDGSTLNVVDTLLLIRQSINDNTDALKNLTNVLADRLPLTSTSCKRK